MTSRGSAATVPPHEGARLIGRRSVSRAGSLADAVRTLEADRGADHALGADRAVAAGAADPCLTARVAVAAERAVGGGGLVPAAGRLLVHRSHHFLVPSVSRERQRAQSRPAHPLCKQYGQAGRLVPVRGIEVITW